TRCYRDWSSDVCSSDLNRQVADYGADLGGPIFKDKLWFWGSYGRQDIRLVRQSGNLIDRTVLADYNLKLNWQASSHDMVNFLFRSEERRGGKEWSDRCV